MHVCVCVSTEIGAELRQADGGRRHDRLRLQRQHPQEDVQVSGGIVSL